MAGNTVDASEHIIILKVHDTRERTFLKFQIKKRTSLRKLMRVFIQRSGLTETTVIFRYNFNIVNGPDTPLSLNMEDGDEIYAYHLQLPPVSSIETPQDASEHLITLKVHDTRAGTFLNFKLKKRMSLRKLMRVFIQRSGLTETTVIFRYNFNIVNGPDTPLSLNMEDGDEIYAYHLQLPPVSSIETPQDASEDMINIRVRDAMRNTSMMFYLRKRKSLNRVMKVFRKRSGLTRTTVIFRYNFNIVKNTDTPLSLNMEDNDVIYAYYFQSRLRVFGRPSIKTMKTKLLYSPDKINMWYRTDLMNTLYYVN